MAFEVARVHGLIRSNIGEDGPSLETSLAPSLHGNVGAVSPPRAVHYVNRNPHSPRDYLHEVSAPRLWSEASASPVDSSACSTSTESDEDDELLAGLAEQIAQSMLEDDENASERNGELDEAQNAADVNRSKSKLSTSWSAGGWLSASTSSSKGSSRVSSQVSSPPSTPSATQNDAWGLLYAAAGEVVRLKMNEERRYMSFPPRTTQQVPQHAQSQWRQQSSQTPMPGVGCVGGRGPLRSFPGSQAIPTTVPSGISPRDRAVPMAPHQQRSWNARMRDEERNFAPRQYPPAKSASTSSGWTRENRSQAPQQQQVNRCGGRKVGNVHHRQGRIPDCNSPQWPLVPAVNGGSGMRAVFLGSGGSGRESCGTGVFLPRCVGGGSDYRRKPVCSTVLLPSRIIQVLNLNVEDMRSHPSGPCAQVHSNTIRSDFQVSNCSTPTPYMTTPAEGWSNSHRKFHPSMLRQPAVPELSLPTEWTY